MYVLLTDKRLALFSEDEKTQLLDVFSKTMRSVFGLSELAFDIDGIEHTSLYRDNEFLHRTYKLKEVVKAKVGMYQVQFRGIRFFATKEVGLLEGENTTLYHVQMSYIGFIQHEEDAIPSQPSIIEVMEKSVKDIRLTTPLKNMAERYIPRWVYQEKK